MSQEEEKEEHTTVYATKDIELQETDDMDTIKEHETLGKAWMQLDKTIKEALAHEEPDEGV